MINETEAPFVPSNKAMRSEAISEILVGIRLQINCLQEMMGYSTVQSDPKQLKWLQVRLATLERLHSCSSFIHELEPVLRRIFPEDGDDK